MRPLTVTLALIGACADDAEPPRDPLTTPWSQSACSDPRPLVVGVTGYDGTYAIDWRCAGRAEIGVGDYLPCDPDNNPIIDAVSMTVVAVPQPSGGLPYRVTIGAFATTAMHENDGPTFSSLAETFGGRYLRGGGIAPCRISVMHTEIAWQTPDNRFVDRWVADAVRR